MSIYSHGDRHLPVRPDLEQLKHQAKDLLRAIGRGDAGTLTALSWGEQFHAKVFVSELAMKLIAEHGGGE